MKALFVYTAKIFSCDGHYYTNNLPASIWRDRYRKLFDSIEVFAREVPVNKCDEALSEYDGVSFCLTSLGIDKRDLITKRKAIYNEIFARVESVDFVVARMGFFGVLAAKAARKLKKPYACEVVGSSWDDLWNYSLSGKMAACWLQPQVKFELRKAKYAVYVTNKYLQKEYPCKGTTIGISNVILPHHESATINRRMERIYKKKESDVVILGTAAAIDVPYKGQRFVIAALCRLNEMGIRCEYRLAGNGSQVPLLRIAEQFGVSSQVKFVGTLPHERMSEFFDGLDIYIQPSLQEGLPRAMIEAMGRGLPSIGAKTAGIPELINHAFVCRRKSVSDIVKAVAQLVRNKELMCKIANENFRKSFEYEKEVLEKRWFNFYSHAIADF